MHRKPFFAAFFCILLVASARPVRAEEIKWNDCEGCHAERGDTKKAPYVDIAALRSSVHGELQCLDCHFDIREVKHVVGRTHHQRYPQRVSCVQRCHVKGNDIGAPDFSPMDQYKDSVHGIAARLGMPDTATCNHCHGRHSIRSKEDPESTVYRANIPRTCAVCHEDMQVVIKHNIHAEKPFQEYEQSVHGKALYRGGLIEVAAICTDCHGSHGIQAAGSSNLKARQPETCGACHKGVYDTYRQSTHGMAYLEGGNSDAPVCSDCHGEHRISIPTEGKIPSICLKCHAEEGIMSKYEIPVDRARTYGQSYHGVASGYGSKTVANCASCHGYHDILPPTDPISSVYPANLVSTCGKPKCHPGISPKVGSARIHVDVDEKESGGIYYVRQVFMWIVVGLVIVTFIWVASDLARRIRQKYKG